MHEPHMIFVFTSIVFIIFYFLLAKLPLSSRVVVIQLLIKCITFQASIVFVLEDKFIFHYPGRYQKCLSDSNCEHLIVAFHSYQYLPNFQIISSKIIRTNHCSHSRNCFCNLPHLSMCKAPIYVNYKFLTKASTFFLVRQYTSSINLWANSPFRPTLSRFSTFVDSSNCTLSFSYSFRNTG